MGSAASPPDALAAAIAAAYANLPEVTAVAIAGSRVGRSADPDADIDLYVYAALPITIADRRAIAASFSIRHEVGNAFWEPSDEWIDVRTGLHVDVMHRTPAWIEEQLRRVLVRHEASVGYSTCFWHNVLHSRPLFDRHGWYGALQTMARQPYPEPLRAAIIAKNYPLLRQSLSSYRAQIERAVERGDRISVQHRIAALLASYFDVLFAVNRLPHPGEKRMLEVAARCAKVPQEMECQVNALLEAAGRSASREVMADINALLHGLDLLLHEECLLP